MGRTTINDWEFPNKGKKPYYEKISSFFNEIDATVADNENHITALQTQANAIYDSTINTGVIATESSYSQQIVTGSYMTSGSVQAVQASIDTGDSTSVTIQFYNGNPAASSVLIYEVAEYNIFENELDDRNIWWMELSGVNQLWLKITNNDLVNPTTLNIRLKIKGD